MRAWLETPRAAANIYEQQYQMGLFLRDHYSGATVALNDIGAADFLADIRCVDLYGLADREVLDAIRARTYGLGMLERLVQERDAAVAILYPNWVRIPSSWSRVGEWKIAHNIVNGGDTVAFYAPDARSGGRLVRALQEHASRLPGTVQQGGFYVDTP